MLFLLLLFVVFLEVCFNNHLSKRSPSCKNVIYLFKLFDLCVCLALKFRKGRQIVFNDALNVWLFKSFI